jgi:hypothetical protein
MEVEMKIAVRCILVPLSLIATVAVAQLPDPFPILPTVITQDMIFGLAIPKVQLDSGAQYCNIWLTRTPDPGLILALQSATACQTGAAPDLSYDPKSGQAFFLRDVKYGATSYSGAILQSIGNNRFSVTAASPNGAEGTWNGSTSTSNVTAFGGDDGDTSFFFWGFGSSHTYPVAYMRGNVSAYGGTAQSPLMRFYSLTDGSLSLGDFFVTYRYRLSMSGSIDIPAKGGLTSYSATYDNSYQTPGSSTAIRGQFTAYVGISMPLTVSPLQITVSDSGAITGNYSAGCIVNGSLLPRPNVNLYDFNFAFSGTTCPNAAGTFTGKATFYRSTELHAAGTNADQSAALLLVGTKYNF